MPPKRVLIVGAGASGMSCASQLSKSPHLFHTTLIESQPNPGGQAFSIPLDSTKFGAEWLNQGVQGGSHIFRHTFHFMRSLGYDVTPVQLQVSFGGNNDGFWSNVFPTSMVTKHKEEIKKFARAMKTVRRLEVVLGMLSVKTFLRLWRFTEDFGNYMVLPTLALFLGTGNETENVPVVILERLFTSETFGMWYPADEERLVGNHPPMVVFPRLGEFYNGWKDKIQSDGVDVRLNTEVLEVLKRDKNGVTVRIKNKQTNEETTEQYDELVLAVLADTALCILGKTATYAERFVLGSAEFADDVTVTHCDEEYVRKYYVNDYGQASQYIPDVGTLNEEDKKRVEVGREFSPMYFIRPYSQDGRKLEMGFDCSNYQAQFPRRDNTNNSPNTSTKSEYPLDENYEHPGLQTSTLPLNKHVFQTIFLNKKRDSHLWTKSEINPEKIIREDWWHQLCHSWTHYVFVVPWIWCLNSTNYLFSSSRRKRTRFAGSWTLVNAHEVAVMSGLAAAWSLGGGYCEEEVEEGEREFAEKLTGGGGGGGGGGEKKGKWEGFAVRCFRLYCLLIYGGLYKGGRKKRD